MVRALFLHCIMDCSLAHTGEAPRSQHPGLQAHSVSLDASEDPTLRKKYRCAVSRELQSARVWGQSSQCAVATAACTT